MCHVRWFGGSWGRAGRPSSPPSGREITALFTDHPRLHHHLEQHSPEDVIETLSTYFELLNSIAERHGGTVVQYLGDCIFVMWNAPVETAAMSKRAAGAPLR